MYTHLGGGSHDTVVITTASHLGLQRLVCLSEDVAWFAVRAGDPESRAKDLCVCVCVCVKVSIESKWRIERCVWLVRCLEGRVVKMGCMIRQDKGFVMKQSVTNYTPTT